MNELQTKYENAVENHKPDTGTRVLRGTPQLHTVVQQGDVYLHYMGPELTEDLKSSLGVGKELGTRQVAVGEGVGSRHVVDKAVVFESAALPATVQAPNGDVEAINGPLIVSGERFRLNHPVHDDHALPPGCWKVTYPYDHKQRARVAD